MELGQHEVERVEFMVAMPENDENCEQQSYRSSTAGEPKVGTAGKEPLGLVSWGVNFHRASIDQMRNPQYRSCPEHC
jgi:hypothetical protein